MTTGGGTTLSRFTPSLMPHELLERLFVARQRTLDAVMARIDAAATSQERNNTLLVGPRGAGKTHLVSIVYHRIKQRQSAGTKLQVAWLPEDPWTLVSYRHLLSAIAERLEPAVTGDLPRSAEELEALLTDRAADDGPIVVVVENLDQILNNLDDEGQQQLRHLLQADRSLLLVATSTRLDRTLSDQSSPFYGFFTTTRLEPFDVDEAAAMLTAIAEEQNNPKLVDYLEGDEGRARLCTIMHLAGGQPRMWAALASALTVEGLDDLVDLLLTRFDDLTPYYQEQLGRLSGQQRLVVAELAEVDRPTNVSELAERLEIDQRSLGKTMSELVDRGWAAPTTSPVTALLDQRRTYYELAEPLARISFQIKESRGGPLRLVVEFLKHWFDPTELDELAAQEGVSEYLSLAADGQDHDPIVAVARRLQRLPITRAPAVALLGDIDDALSALMARDPEPFLRLPMPVRAALEQQIGDRDTALVRMEIHQTAQVEFGHTRHPAMGPWIARAESLIAMSGTSSPTSTAQLILADWLGRAWRFDEAVEVFEAAERDLDDHSLIPARASLAHSYWNAGRIHQAIELEQQVLADRVRVLGPDDLLTLSARSNLAISYRQLGQPEKSVELLEGVIKDRERILGADHPSTIVSRSNLAHSYLAAERTEESIRLMEEAIEDQTRVLGAGHISTLTSRSILATAYRKAGQITRAVELGEAVIADQQHALGSDHPLTLDSKAGLASSYQAASRTDDAIALMEALIVNLERVLGGDHPVTLTARGSLAAFYWHAGLVSKARRLAQAALGDLERVLGPGHPATRDAQFNLDTMSRERTNPGARGAP